MSIQHSARSIIHTVFRSQILMTFLSALRTIPLPAIRLPPSNQATFFRGNPYPWSLNANGRGERISYSRVCPVDVPTAYESPSDLAAIAVTANESDDASSSTPGSVTLARPVLRAIRPLGKSSTPTTERDRGSQNCTRARPSMPNASRWCAGLMSMQLTPRIGSSPWASSTSGFKKRPCSRLRRYISFPEAEMRVSQEG